MYFNLFHTFSSPPHVLYDPPHAVANRLFKKNVLQNIHTRKVHKTQTHSLNNNYKASATFCQEIKHSRNSTLQKSPLWISTWSKNPFCPPIPELTILTLVTIFLPFIIHFSCMHAFLLNVVSFPSFELYINKIMVNVVPLGSSHMFVRPICVAAWGINFHSHSILLYWCTIIWLCMLLLVTFQVSPCGAILKILLWITLAWPSWTWIWWKCAIKVFCLLFYWIACLFILIYGSSFHNLNMSLAGYMCYKCRCTLYELSLFLSILLYWSFPLW